LWALTVVDDVEKDDELHQTPFPGLGGTLASTLCRREEFTGTENDCL